MQLYIHSYNNCEILKISFESFLRTYGGTQTYKKVATNSLLIEFFCASEAVNFLFLRHECIRSKGEKNSNRNGTKKQKIAKESLKYSLSDTKKN